MTENKVLGAEGGEIIRPNPGDATSIGAVMEEIQGKIKTAADVANKRALPGVRWKIVKHLEEANALLNTAMEVLRRSGYDKKLGLVKTPDGIVPVKSPE
jgi:hypothetical protein